MKILTEKEQLRFKLEDIDEAIKFAIDEQEHANKRMERKQNWGILSFITDEGWLLRYNYKQKSLVLKLLREYSVQILNRFNIVK